MKISPIIVLGLHLVLWGSMADKSQGAVGNTIIDSLKAVVASSGEDTVKAEVLNSLSWNLKNRSEYDESLKYAEQALELSRRLNYHSGIADALCRMGNIYDYQSDYDKAIHVYAKSLDLYEMLGNRHGMASIYNNVGLIYYNQSAYPQALEHYFNALKIAEELNIKMGIGLLSNNIGLIYYHQMDYPKALDYYMKSLKIGEESGDLRGVARAYNNIGIMCEDQGKYAEALTYHNLALLIREENDYEQGKAHSYTNLGNLHMNLYKFIGDQQNLLGSSGLSEELKEMITKNPEKLLDTSMYYHKKALAIKTELSDEFGMSSNLSGMANVYQLEGNYAKAINYYTQASTLADAIGALGRSRDAHKGLADTYDLLEEYEMAFEHFKIYSTLKDSLFNEEKSKDLGKLEAKHEFETAELERQRVDEEEEKIASELKSRRDNLQYSSILIVIILLFSGILMIGRLSIPIRLAEGMIFFTFLLFFEFTLVLLDPYIELYSSGAPAIKLGFNALLAALIFPLHSLFETKLKARLMSTNE